MTAPEVHDEAAAYLEIVYSKPIAHGTPRGYTQHLERRVELCDACRLARADYLKELKARRAPQTDQPQEEAPSACGDKRGTRAGYQRHYNASELACDPCQRANTDYGRVYRQNRPKAEIDEGFREVPHEIPAYAHEIAEVPFAVLGALLSAAPTEVEEWAEQQLGADLVTKAISAAGNEFLELTA